PITIPWSTIDSGGPGPAAPLRGCNFALASAIGQAMAEDLSGGVFSITGGILTAPGGPPLPPLCVADMDDGYGCGVPDGGVGIEDLIYYLGQFDAGNLRADVDDGSGLGHPDGGVGIEDLLYYLVRFDSG